MQDLTLRNADNTPPAGNLQRWRQESELQCGFLFGCVGDLGRGGGDYQAFLCSSSKMKKQEVKQEENSVQNGAYIEDWNHPHHSRWHGSGPVDNGRGPHQIPSFHVANISPPKMFIFGVARRGMTCRLRLMMVSLGSAISRVTECSLRVLPLGLSENLSKAASTNQSARWAA